VKHTVGWQALMNVGIISPGSPREGREKMMFIVDSYIPFCPAECNPCEATQQGDWSEDYYSDIFLCHSVERLESFEDKPVELI
jgi:hypothetical protein